MIFLYLIIKCSKFFERDLYTSVNIFSICYQEDKIIENYSKKPPLESSKTFKLNYNFQTNFN